MPKGSTKPKLSPGVTFGWRHGAKRAHFLVSVRQLLPQRSLWASHCKSLHGFCHRFPDALTIIATVLMHREWTAVSVDREPTPIREIVARTPLARRCLFSPWSTPRRLRYHRHCSCFLWKADCKPRDGKARCSSFSFWPLRCLRRFSLALPNGLVQSEVLLAAMVLAIASFAYTLTLSSRPTNPICVVCVLSGATIGADLTLLPAFCTAHVKDRPKRGSGI